MAIQPLPPAFFQRWALVCAGLAGVACGSSGGSATATDAAVTTTSDAASGIDTAAATTGCDTKVLKVLFTPMYSAFDGVHTFQIPAVVNGLDESVVTWSASDPSLVDLAKDPSTGGVMITTRKAGTVSIIASAGGLCGASLLTIAATTADDWTLGSQRYNDGVVLGPPGPPGMNGGSDGGTDAASFQDAACTNCHGATATDSFFKTVSHTPEQTGGFSDADLMNIFRHGTVPKGGYFDASIIPYEAWQGLHNWDMSDDQARGIIVYLRSLAPTPQTGQSNFGGMFMPGDGGRPPGPPPDDGTPDAGAGN